MILKKHLIYIYHEGSKHPRLHPVHTTFMFVDPSDLAKNSEEWEKHMKILAYWLFS